VARAIGTDIDRRTFLSGTLAGALLASVPGGRSTAVTSAGSRATGSEGGLGLPEAVVAGYWTYWSNPPSLGEIDPGYNTLYLFHCEPVGGPLAGDGSVRWKGPTDAAFRSDLARWRALGNCALLTVGGAGAQVPLDTRARSRELLGSILGIHRTLGGFDGLDWNNYEGMDAPPTDEMIWVSHELKRALGDRFAITSPPAPWRTTDMDHCRAMIDAGALDLVTPQYYAGSGLNLPEYIRSSTMEWVRRMGDPRRVGIGFGVATAGHYTTIDEALAAWDLTSQRVPGLRGAYNWDITMDAAVGYAFAQQLGPRILLSPRGVTAPMPILPPLVPPMAAPVVGRALVAAAGVGGALVLTGDTPEPTTPADVVPAGVPEEGTVPDGS
jgi:hypothetical protein